MTDSNDNPIVETEEELIAKAQASISQCNWVVGECASKWTQKYAKGRTDADFGELVGLSPDQVYQRRRVWETFLDVLEDYPSLRWSHFYVALNWDDSSECLQWASENSATVAEMRAWRRLQNGEDLTQPSDDDLPEAITFMPTDPTLVREPGVGTETSDSTTAAISTGAGSESTATVSAAARETNGPSGGDYAPFRQGAGSPAPSEETDVAVADRAPKSIEVTVKRMTTTLERCKKVITPEFADEFENLPDKLRNRFIKAVGELSAKVADLG
ncbi:MAG: hypothetical protein CMJ78_00765 [Planctomycetaceae bacterium]|nr:hypothetical protein [Planctomycetaceae bacterium]